MFNSDNDPPNSCKEVSLTIELTHISLSYTSYSLCNKISPSHGVPRLRVRSLKLAEFHSKKKFVSQRLCADVFQHQIERIIDMLCRKVFHSSYFKSMFPLTKLSEQTFFSCKGLRMNWKALSMLKLFGTKKPVIYTNAN